MRHVLITLALFFVIASSAFAQPTSINAPFLEGLAGTWVLRGTIAGQETTHDVVAEWILEHHYLRIQERSREKDPKGHAKYEALVLIGWDSGSSEYQCLWLDVTGGGGLAVQFIARGKKTGESIPFLFREPDNSISFINTFSFDKASSSWTWHMDNIKDGKPVPFGRVRLTRK